MSEADGAHERELAVRQVVQTARYVSVQESGAVGRRVVAIAAVGEGEVHESQCHTRAVIGPDRVPTAGRSGRMNACVVF